MNPNPLLQMVASSWWVLALRGALAVFFALGAFLWPGLTLLVLVVLWGAFALMDGLMAVVVGARMRWWSILIFGLVGVAAGVLTFLRPGITALALISLIGAWAIIRGVFEVAAAIRLRKEISNEWLLILSGLASFVFGVLVLLFPGAGALSLVWLIGIYALLIGILLFTLAFRLRGLGQRSV
jgi:uncharacterized membrane protein HdeD (DUF308 family)